VKQSFKVFLILLIGAVSYDIAQDVDSLAAFLTEIGLSD
jgi:hypothetical protein